MKQGLTIKWLETVDSTQDEIHRQLEVLANLSVVAALDQTAGRGQRGNRWETRPGENLTFSFLLRPGQDGIRPIPASDQFLLSEIATLAMHETLSDFNIPTQIKWPNDIYAGDRKICGMLIENNLRGRTVAHSIIGIGLNVNQTRFNPGLINPVSMKKITGETYDIRAVLDHCLAHFCEGLDADRQQIRARYLSNLYRMGQLHSYTDCKTGTVFDGTITGISERGLLCVEMPDKSIREFGFKEISYII